MSTEQQESPKKVRSIVGCEMTTGEREMLYLVPVCKRCGHAICPCCGNWCDSCFESHFDGKYDADELVAEGPDFNAECADTNKCVFDGEVEEVGPLYGMELPEWLEKQRSLEGEIWWLKKLLRIAIKGGLSERQRAAIERIAKDDEEG